MDENGWLCVDLAGFGWIWLDMAGYGWIWLDMAGYGWVWLGMAGYGRIWLEMAGYVWTLLHNYGSGPDLDQTIACLRLHAINLSDLLQLQHQH